MQRERLTGLTVLIGSQFENPASGCSLVLGFGEGMVVTYPVLFIESDDF
jgi:hypothetical protein